MLKRDYANKFLIIAFLASVGLNIWLVGFVLGNKADEYQYEHRDRRSRFERKVQMLTKDLSPAAQKQFMDDMRDYMPDVEGQFWNSLAELNHDLADSITGENVDVEAAQKVFFQIRTSWARTHMEFQGGFLKAVQELSPEDRKKIAETLVSTPKSR